MAATTAAVLGGAALVMTAAGAKNAKDAEKDAASARARLAAIQSANVLERGKTEADQILSEAIRVRGYQMAQQASSGVVVGDGSAQHMVQETTNLAKADALVAIADSEEQAKQIRAGASYDASASKSRQSAITTTALSNMLGIAANTVNNVHSINTTKTGGVV